MTERNNLLTILACQVKQIERQKLYRFGVIARQVQELAEQRLNSALEHIEREQLHAIGWRTW